MQEREKPKGEVPLELKLLYALSRDPNDRVQIETSSEQTTTVGTTASIMGRLWDTIGSSEVGGLLIRAKGPQERLPLDALSENEIVDLIGALSIYKRDLP